MRFFEMVNLQQFILYLFPAWAFILIFAAGLSFAHFRTQNTDKKMNQIIERYPGDIEGRNAPFPLVLYIIIVGTVLWSLGYIFFIGLLGVKI